MQDVSEQLLERIASRLRAMGNPVRLKILHTLEEGELSVTEILAEIGGSQANISKHLAVLRAAGLVESRREGVSVFYRIGDDAVFTVCQTVCESLQDRAAAEAQAIRRGREAMLAARH